MNDLALIAAVFFLFLVGGFLFVLYGSRQTTNGLSEQANQIRRQAAAEKPYIITASYAHSTAGEADLQNEGPHEPRRNYFYPPERVSRHEAPPLGPLGLFGVDPNDHVPSIFQVARPDFDRAASNDVELSRILASAPNLSPTPPLPTNEQILAAKQPKPDPIEAHFKEPQRFEDWDVMITNVRITEPRKDGRPPLTKDNQE